MSRLKDKSGMIFVIMGAVLMLSALLLLFYNRMEDRTAGREAEEGLHQIKEELGEATVPESEKKELPLPTDLPVMEAGGYGYIGYLKIHALDLELPVMEDWDYERLKKAPCRQFGSPVTEDLVVAAHNYKRHFGRLSELEQGDRITFINMDGYPYEYEVDRIEKLEPEAVDEVQQSGYPLVLYTCTYGGENRVAVFCKYRDRDIEEKEVQPATVQPE